MGARGSSPVTVGREPEIARLRAAFARAVEGRPSTVVIAGEAGMGKTRLVSELATEVEASGGLALSGACIRVDAGGLPYHPWVQVLRALLAKAQPGTVARVLGPARSEVARLVPELGDRITPTDPASAQFARMRLFELLGGVAERLGGTGPTLIVIEDVEWADPSSRDLVAFLVRTVRAGQLMLALTHRTDEPTTAAGVDQLLLDLGRLPSTDWIDLQPLTVDGVRDLASAIIGRRPGPDAAQAIARRAGGNPFLVEELLEQDETDGAAGPGLVALLQRRLATLPHDVRSILAVAAVAGGSTDDATIHDVSPFAERETDVAIHAALDATVLVRIRDEYSFRHGLMAEAVESDLLPAERRRLHAALATSLERREPVDAWQLARIASHWLSAGERRRALTASDAAGRAAERAYAFTEAAQQYERALELLDQLAGEGSQLAISRLGLIQRTAEVSALAGDPTRAIELAKEGLAYEATAVDSDRPALAQLHRRLRWSLSDIGSYEAALADAEALLAGGAEAAPPETWSNALAHHSGLLLSLGRFETALEVAKRAREAGVENSAAADEGIALGVGGWSLIWLGRPDEGIDQIEAAVRIAHQLGLPHALGLAMRHRAAANRFVGRHVQALEAASTGVAASLELGLQRTFGPGLAIEAAMASIELGRWMEADRLLTDAVDRGPAGADGVDLALLASIRALQRTGQMSPSRDEASAGIAERPLDRVGLDQRLAAEIASLTGEPTQARDLALAAVESRRPMPPLTRVALMAIGAGGAVEAGIQARATRNPGEAEASFKVARRLQAVAGEVARPLTSGPAASTMRDEIEAWTLEARAHVARVGPSAADAWAEVSGRWLELGRPPRALGASVIEVEALAGGRDRARAQAVLERAYDLARELGAEAVRRQLETLARGMRLRVPGSEPGTRTPESQRPFGLTKREREVLALVAAGRTNREIGDALAMSASTASVHVSRILSKLGVQGRVEAAAAAIRAGLDRLD